MRFVPAKRIEQQDIQSIHRIRSLLVARRTAQANQIRGLLLEYGIIILKGIACIKTRKLEILEDAENTLTSLFRELLVELYEEMAHLDQMIATLELKLPQNSFSSLRPLFSDSLPCNEVKSEWG
jgi:transposase